MGLEGSATFRADAELGKGQHAVVSAAHALAALRRFAFGYCHGSKLFA